MTPAAIHAAFVTRAGSEQISSLFACEALAWWIRRRQPATLYEVGGGIGCLSAVILSVVPWKDRRFSYTVEESDAWCRSQWDANTRAPVGAALKVTSWFPPKRPIDLLILDGGDQRDDDYRHLARRAVIFVEGRRRPQRSVLRARLTQDGRAFAEAEWKPLRRAKGYAVVQLDPTVVERVWFLSVRMREAVLDGVATVLGCPVGKKRKEA